jgi:hypothetical protein
MVITALVILVTSLNKSPAEVAQILHVHTMERITLKIKTRSTERNVSAGTVRIYVIN